MPVFRPPTQPDALVGGGEAAHPLWRHYGAYETGITVWKGPDGQWRQSAYPYQGGAEYRTFNDDSYTITTDDVNTGLATATKVFIGGSEYPITEAERTELIAAGFGAYVSYDSYLKINNISSYFSTPDKPSLNPVNLDVRIFAQSDVGNDWRPVFLSNHIVSKGSSQSWVVSVHPNGAPRTALYPAEPDGDLGPENDEALGFIKGAPHWFRSTVLFTGQGQREFRYWVSPNGKDGEWHQLGRTYALSTINSGLTQTPADLMVPGSAGGLSWMARFYYMELRDDIDGNIVANPDFRNLAPGTTSFTDGVGNVWTRTGTDVEIVGV